MDIREGLLALVKPLRPNDEVEPGIRFEHASTEFGWRYRFDVAGEPLWIDLAPIEPSGRYATRTALFGVSYRTEGGRSPVPQATAQRVCGRVSALVLQNEDEVAAAMKRGQSAGKVRRTRVTSALELTGSSAAPHYTLSPYVGCLVGCKFCYAQTALATTRRFVGLDDVAWGSYVDVRENAPEVLRDELERLPVHPIKFCPIVSDPYHAIEKTERMTARCLEVIGASARSWPTLVLTRSTMILRDVELLAGLPQLVAGVSLPTLDDEVRRVFESRAASVDDRLLVLKELKRHGVRTMAVVQPVLCTDLTKMADTLAGLADSVSLDILRGEAGATEEFGRERYSELRTDAFQKEAVETLSALLAERGVPVWRGELPPDFAG